MENRRTDVLVIGGGIAGLAAAYELCNHGINVLLLEARERLGGRIWTLHPRNVGAAVELGAEFIHGRPPELWKLVRSASLKTERLTGEFWCKDDNGLRRCDKLFAQVDKIFEAMKPMGRDRSFADFLREQGRSFSLEARERATSYVEGFHAADRNRISVHSLIKSNKADEAIDGDEQFRITSGYDSLVQALLERIPKARFSFRLNTAVQRVEWGRGQVRVRTASRNSPDREFATPLAVITLPLGVLKARQSSAGAVRFIPSLTQKRDAINALEMGPVARVTLHFKRRFWAEKDFIPEADQGLSKVGFLFAQDDDFPTWWTLMPRQVPLLTGWAAGPHAKALAGCSPREISQRAIRALPRIFGLRVAAVQALIDGAYFHDWQHDRFCNGAYSYATVGAVEAPRELAAPLEDTLFFAGEATDFNGHNGTVHGALASGYRAAREALESRAQRRAS